jgi:hypothetical protein
MNQLVRDLKVSSEPARKVPITTQSMWEFAVEDYEHERTMLEDARGQPNVAPEIIAWRERRLRIRLAICNAIDFLISNRDDINTIFAKRKR